MGLQPIQFNVRFGTIAACQISHELDGSVVQFYIPQILNLKYERMEQKYHFSGSRYHVSRWATISSPHIGEDVLVAK